jgi:hypothetical protein
MAVALVTLVAAGAANAQAVLDAQFADWNYTTTTTRDTYAYLENSPSPYFMPMGNYNYFGVADDIRFVDPVNVTSFDVAYYSRITAFALPLKMEVNFYSYWTENGGYIYAGDHNWGHFEVEGLGTGSNTVTVDVEGAMWLPRGVWMEIGFYDTFGNYAVDTGVRLARDWGAEVGITSNDYYLGMLQPGLIGGLYWNGGYTPTLPMTDPNWNPASNYIIGISVPEPLTLGLVVLGGLLAVRRRR